MKCYTFKKNGCCIVDGIRVNDDGTIHVGEEGRGRLLTKVPLPEGSIVQTDEDGARRLTCIRGDDVAVVLFIEDSSGFRGSWALEYQGAKDGWTEIASGRCAQGTAGHMGGGPEYLGILTSYGSLIISRTGRLYGKSARLAIQNPVDGLPEVLDLEEAERTEAASGAFKVALAKIADGFKCSRCGYVDPGTTDDVNCPNCGGDE